MLNNLLKASVITVDNGGAGGDNDLFTVPEPEFPGAWDISNTDIDNSFSLSGLTPLDLFFKPDGSKMYIPFTTRNITEYNLSTPWDVSTASFLQSLSVTDQDRSPFGLFFKPDGTKMYMLGERNDSVYEYDLSTAWDISTASFLQSFSVATEDTRPGALTFKPDGTKMYVGGQREKYINEYDLSTAWDISTASFLQRTFSYKLSEGINIELNPDAMVFRQDGTKLYVTGSGSDGVSECDLSIAWDISTLTLTQKISFSTWVGESAPRGLYFKPNGNKFYMAGQNNRAVFAYNVISS